MALGPLPLDDLQGHSDNQYLRNVTAITFL